MLRTQKTASTRYELALSPKIARLLSVASIGSLWGWFILKFYLQDDASGLAGAVGMLALLGVGGSMILLATQYLNQAYGKDHEIDERERAVRDRAHRVALNYVLWVFVLTYVVLEVASRAPAPTATGLVLGFPATISKGVVENFLVVLFFTTFALPPAILAWWDRGDADTE
ncbi:MAG: hypothetical protein RL625_1266 [Gemmatimonadota bacterium]